MINSTRKRWMLPLLALGLTLALASAAQAQTGINASMQINLGSSTHWTSVRGTRVREIRQDQRPGYDMFRYGSKYYAYNNNQWYSSNRGNGAYGAIEDRDVPSELSKVPQDHWHTYPANWRDRNNKPASDGNHR